MTVLLLGLSLFLGVHLIPTAPRLRGKLQDALGERGYKGAFSLAALVGLGLMVWGKSRAPFVPLYAPPGWGWHAAMGLMLLSCLSFAAVYVPSNIRRWTAHPLLLGTVLWAGGHLAANGDVASVFLFGGLLGFAALDMWSASRRGARPGGVVLPVWRDLVLVVAGAAVYVGLLVVHPYVFGVSVLR